MRLHAASAAGRSTRPAAFLLRLVVVVALCIGSGLVASPAAHADPGSTENQEWWIDRLGLDDVWKISKGAGVTVAVLDGGVQASVGDLRGAVVAGFDSVGHGNGESDTDSEGHGTRMASLIAGRGTNPGVMGVAPQAKILPVYVPTEDENNYTVVALNRLSAMSHPPQVVNMSFGAPGDCPADMQAAVKKAVDKGMILVASAGNEGSSTNESQSPANCAGVIAVGAYDQQLQPWSDTQRQKYVALAGPGVRMIGYKPSGEIFYGTGTSDAAAIVSGSIAVVRAHFPSMPSRQLVARIIATARQFQGQQGSHNNVFGWGAARPHHALTDRVPANAPNPVYAALDRLGGGTPSAAPPTGGASSGAASSAGSAAQSGPPLSVSQAGSNKKSSSSGLLIGVLVAVLAVALIVIAILMRGRRRQQYPH